MVMWKSYMCLLGKAAWVATYALHLPRLSCGQIWQDQIASEFEVQKVRRAQTMEYRPCFVSPRTWARVMVNRFPWFLMHSSKYFRSDWKQKGEVWLGGLACLEKESTWRVLLNNLLQTAHFSFSSWIVILHGEFLHCKLFHRQPCICCISQLSY